MLRRGRKWNGLNFKRLGKVRVIIFENIFAIVAPVDLSSYAFVRRCRDRTYYIFMYGFSLNSYAKDTKGYMWVYIILVTEWSVSHEMKKTHCHKECGWFAPRRGSKY